MHWKNLNPGISPYFNPSPVDSKLRRNNVFSYYPCTSNWVSRIVTAWHTVFRDEPSQPSIRGYNEQDKQNARSAVEQLCQIKKSSGNFTEQEIVKDRLVGDVMNRYRFKDIDELNNWLDTF